MKNIFFVIAAFCFYAAGAQEYNVMLIPDSLLNSANYIIRNEEYNIEIKSLDNVIIRHKYAITILNENADRYAIYHNSYKKDSPLSDIDGNLYDAYGKKLRNVKRKDIGDVPSDDGFSLMGDERIKYHSWFWKDYPYTVEYEDEKQMDQTFFIEGWSPVPTINCSVQNSKYTITYPQSFKLRYKPVNYTGTPRTTTDKDNITMTWSLNNFKAINYEPLMPDGSRLLPGVLMAPSDFVYEGYKGSLTSWADYGKFQLMLNKDRDILPDNVKAQVHAIADGLKTKEEKVSALYQYLQNNSRYISIQLGIGGFQPFDAKYVAEKKYGDCKALSNFMVALLKEAGIGANYVLVEGDRSAAPDYLREDFPDDYFNHVICCVPNDKDSIWLECTEQTLAAGYMGTFTGNRKALLVAADGGHVVSTPFYKSADNQQIRSVKASIDGEGNLDAEVYTDFSGTRSEREHEAIYFTQSEREKYLNNSIDLATYKVDKNEYTEDKKRIPVVHQSLHVTSPGYASVTGKRLFIKPDIFNRWNIKLSKDSIRKYDISFRLAYRDIDSVSIALPEGYSLEAMPKDVQLTTKFGTYSVSYKVDGTHLYMIRTHENRVSTFPASDYTELVSFFDAMYKADRSQFVFVKKEN